MSLEELAFLALAIIAIGTALLALLSRELVHTIVWVGVFFVDLGALYFLLQATFLGVLQLGVYAGAVTILLLFGIMVTRKRIFSREAATGITPVPIGLSVLAFVFLAAALPELNGQYAFWVYDPSQLSQQLFAVGTTPAGFVGGSPWLLLLGVIMLTALVGAIYLVREGRE